MRKNEECENDLCKKNKIGSRGTNSAQNDLNGLYGKTNNAGMIDRDYTV